MKSYHLLSARTPRWNTHADKSLSVKNSQHRGEADLYTQNRQNIKHYITTEFKTASYNWLQWFQKVVNRDYNHITRIEDD